jgi:hypothetical protein
MIRGREAGVGNFAHDPILVKVNLEGLPHYPDELGDVDGHAPCRFKGKFELAVHAEAT